MNAPNTTSQTPRIRATTIAPPDDAKRAKPHDLAIAAGLVAAVNPHQIPIIAVTRANQFTLGVYRV